MELSPLQEQVVAAVKAWGSTRPWFQGVCLNEFPTDAEIQEDFDGAVQQVCMTTAYWDAPDFFNP